MWRQIIFTQLRLAISSIFMILLTSSIIQGQTASHVREPQRNFVQAGAFNLSEFESINTMNGNLILRYALGQLPPGRGGMRAAFYLQYNSKLHDTFIDNVQDITGFNSDQNLLRESSESGWKLRFRYELLVTNRNDNEINGGYEAAAASACNSQGSSTEQNELATYRWKVKLRFPDGGEHLFRPSGYADARGDGYFNVNTYGQIYAYGCSRPPGSTGCSCNAIQSTDPNPKMTYYTADGSYLRLTIERNQDWTLYYPDGGKIVSVGAQQRVYDRNGNYLEILNNTISDNTGRSIALTYDATTGDDLITQIGVSGDALVWRIKWKTVSITDRPYSTTAAVSGQQQGNTSVQSWASNYLVVDKIILPTQLGNLSYTFNYNTSSEWAEVSLIILPASESETPPQVAYQYSYPGELANGLPKCTNILRSHPSIKTVTWQEQVNGTTTQKTETWLYAIDNTTSIVTSPDGGVTTQYYGDTQTPSVDAGLLKRIERPDGTKTEHVWALNTQPWIGTLPPPMSERNSFVKTEFTSIKDSAGNYSKTAIKDYDYDKNGNLLTVSEYDWINYSDVVRDANGLPVTIPSSAASALKRVTVNTYNNATPSSTISGNHVNAYWNLSPYTTFVLGAIASSEIRPSANGTPLTRTEFTYDNPATTANPTITRSWDSSKGALGTLTSGNSIAVTNEFGAYVTGGTGKLIRTIDAKGVSTRYFYEDIGNGTTDLYVTKTIAADGTSFARTSEQKYDFNTGAVTESKDTDNNVVTKNTLDIFGRPILIQEAFQIAGQERITAIEYSDTMRRVITRADMTTTGDGKLVSVQHYDQLGRLRLSRTLENSQFQAQDPYDEQQGIKVQSRYAYSGSNRYEIASSPYRAANSGAAGAEVEMGWTRTKFDQGGKVLEVETFAGAGLPFPWGTNSNSTGKVTTAYNAESVTVTDQANRSRRTMVDGLGRLIQVNEAPNDPGYNYQTNYTYDPLGNLIRVRQGGFPTGGSPDPTVQFRRFYYDSLSRLAYANNPEQDATIAFDPPGESGTMWTMKYEYDDNGNLTKRTDARQVATTYQYDALNRNVRVTYSDGTPEVKRYYDTTVADGSDGGGTFSNGKGRLRMVISLNNHPNGSGQAAHSRTVINGYDKLGRVTSQRQGFLKPSGAWQDYSVTRTYDRASHVTSQIYPTSASVSYNYGPAGRTNWMDGTLGGEYYFYSSGMTYNAAGQMTEEQFGMVPTPLYHTMRYNNRFQMIEVNVGTFNDLNNPNSSSYWDRGRLRFFYNSNALSSGNPADGGVDNNGNVLRQEHWVPVTVTQKKEEEKEDDKDGNQPGVVTSYAIPMRDDYYYDPINRITRVSGRQVTTAGIEQQIYQQAYSYDKFGNRKLDIAQTWGNAINGSQVSDLYDVNKQNNRLMGMIYDAAGNLRSAKPSTQYDNRVYDAENRMTSAWTGLNPGQYVYDGDGRRVRRIVNGVENWQVYGIDGELLAEYEWNGSTASLKKEYGYRDGQLLIVADPTETDANKRVKWLVTDHLGTPRMVVDKTGSLSGVTRHDYLPFGEDLMVGMGNGSLRSTGMGYVADSVRQNFVGYEKDIETNLDFAQARYFSNLQGRFTSPDSLHMSAIHTNPQSWNRYSYVGNRPTTLIDPSGLAWGYFSGNAGSWYKWFDDEKDIEKNGGTVVKANAGDGFIYQAIGGKWVRLDLSQNHYDLYDTQLQAFYGTLDIPTAMGDLENTLNLFFAVQGIGGLARFGIGAISRTLSGTSSEVTTLGLGGTALGTARVASGTGGDIAEMVLVETIPKGSRLGDIINRAKELTFSTGNEHALVKLASGERALVSGGPGGINFAEGQIIRLYGHTHPFQSLATGASAADRAAIQALGQKSSFLLERGNLIKFTQNTQQIIQPRF